MLDNKIYDVLKWVAMIVMPALTTFTAAIMAIWNLPYADQIVGTMSAVNTLLGAILGISNINYKRGK